MAKGGLGQEGKDFLPDFEEFMEREQLKYSRLEISEPADREKFCSKSLPGISWVFWNRQDDNPYLTLSYDHSADSIPDVCASPKVRLKLALQKMILHPGLKYSLVQFWSPTKTSEGRILLTTQYQPFAIGTTYENLSIRHQLCKYRMGMRREHNFFYADAESVEEQLGLPGRVFLNSLPESTPHVNLYSPKEYPNRDLALRCMVRGSWALPVFGRSSYECHGVLEIVSTDDVSELRYNSEFLRRMYYVFQEFGLRSFDGYIVYKRCHIQYGDENKALTAAFQELNMVCESVCKIHDIALALTWVSCRFCYNLLQSQIQFPILHYCDEEDNNNCSFNLRNIIEVCKVCHLRKGRITGRTRPFPNLLYCSDVKQFSIAESPLVPYARYWELGGWLTMCLQSSYTGDELYVLEFFFPASNKNDENILTKLSLILGTMEEYFKTFKLASGQGLGEALSVEVIDFQNGQRSHLIRMIPARCIPGLELLNDGEAMLHLGQLELGQLEQPSVDATNNIMYDITEAQTYNLPSLDSLQDGNVTTQLDSSDQRSMDPSSNEQNVVTTEQNIIVVSNSEKGKRKMQDIEHKKAGVRIEISLEQILKCSNMKRNSAARELKVSISTLKRVCRDHGIHRWPPRNVEKVQPLLPSPIENQGQTPTSGTLANCKKKVSNQTVEKVQPFLPVPIENQGQTPQLNSDLPSNEASGSVANIKSRFQDADMVTIRATCEKDTIKFRLFLSSRLVEMQHEVAKRLNLEGGTYYIKYKDEADVLILIACDEDLHDCLHTTRSPGTSSIEVVLEPK